MFRTFIVVIFVLNCLKHENVAGQCNTCSTSGNYKCTAANRYQFCDFQGNPVGLENTCPANLLCSTSTSAICIAPFSGTVPDCTCGICGNLPNYNVACISDTQYSYCSTTDNVFPDTETYTCPLGMQCNEFPNSPCSPRDILGPRTNSCPENSVANENCTRVGNFMVANSQCKRYYTCVFVNGIFNKYLYSCPGNSTFSSLTHKCGLYGCN